MPTTKFYPPITAILPVDALPNELGFIKDGLEKILGRIYFRDLQYSTNDRGDAGFYSLSIVSLERLDIEIPGTGIFLILNPSHDPLAGDQSDFPVSVAYQWPILGYLRQFNLDTFSFQPGDLFDLALRVLGVTPRGAVERALNLFAVSVDTFVQDVNDLFDTTITPPPAGSDDPIGDVLVQIDAEGKIKGAGGAVFVLYLLDALSESTTRERIRAFFSEFFEGNIDDYLGRLLIPNINATLEVGLALEFPRNVLEPLDAVGGEPLGEPARTWLTFKAGSFYFSTDRGIGFDQLLEANLNYPSRIAGSGLGISLDTAKLDISRTTNIPEADADGRPADFIGVYINDATISFPAFWNHDGNASTGVIHGLNLLLGTGGFSGTLALEGKSDDDPAPFIRLRFGDDFAVSLDAFSLTLKQNSITGSSIEGTLRIPGFNDANNNPADIRIKVAIHDNGDFDITAHEDDGFKEIHFGTIFSITLKSVFFGTRDDDFYIGVSGGIRLTHPMLADIITDEIEVEKLVIWSDGRFEIEGGTLPLPQNFRFPIGPVELSISAIHFGSHQQEHEGKMRNYRYFGFDGGVDINPGGVDVRGKGIKFYYTVDDDPNPANLKKPHSYLEIKSIAIDLIIPGNASKETAALLVSGFLSITGGPGNPEYEGGVSFSLPKIKIAGGASMKYAPKSPAFLIDAFVELSAPIPLGATGLGIYGFRGLFGHRYVASKQAAGLTESDTWFQYYKAPPGEGVRIEKFDEPDQTRNYDNPFSIGAGISLGTAADGGKTFSSKLFLLLSLPEVLYLEGRANILGDRVGLTGEDPPFFAMLAISPQSVETAFGADYDIPKSSGAILDTYAEVQAAFFFQNASAWYVNFGTEEKRITARVLSLFNATSYIMLSAAGISAGSGVSYGFEKSYAGGMVSASVKVYLEMGGHVSFERPQIGGFIMLGGHVDAYLLFIGFHIVLDTSLSVEVPDPFIIQGRVHLCVGVTIGFWKFKVRIEKCFDVQFRWGDDDSANLDPVAPFRQGGADVQAPSPASATNMLSGESFKVAELLSADASLPSHNHAAFNDAVLPLDSWVDLEFLKGLFPSGEVDARIGRLSGGPPANYIDLIPPAEVPNKVSHEYSIAALEIKAWSGSAWVDYRPYQAMSTPDALVTLNANPEKYRDGYWQNTGTGFNKLRLLSETSLSYMEQGEPGWYVPEQFGITSATLFCKTKLRKERCLSWTGKNPGTIYPAGKWQQSDTVLWRVIGGEGSVVAWSGAFGIPRSLSFANRDMAQIVFNTPCVTVKLKLTTFSSGVVVRFYKRETVGNGFVHVLAETRTLTQLQLLAPVVYNDASTPVTKVEIEPASPDPAALHALQLHINDLYRHLYEDMLTGEAYEAMLQDIHELEEERQNLEGQGCNRWNITREELLDLIEELNDRIAICHNVLETLRAEQERICGDSSTFIDRFRRCFPYVPSVLSYQIDLERRGEAAIRYRFEIFDDAANAVLFRDADGHETAGAAESAMYVALAAAMLPDAFISQIDGRGRYFFQIEDADGVVRAVGASFFEREEGLEQYIAEVRGKLLSIYAGGVFRIASRVQGEMPCPVCMDHLDCWEELLSYGERGSSGCRTIIERIRAASASFCREYDSLYRELYICNRATLDILIRRCEELDRQILIRTRECEHLRGQREGAEDFIDYIDVHGPLHPPAAEPCSTLLHEVCTMWLEDYQFNESIPAQEAIESDYQNTVEAIEKMLAPIWRPDTKYLIYLNVGDKVVGNTSIEHSFHRYFGFRTAGPVGYFHTDPSAGYVQNGKSDDQYMLTGLKGYIDYQRSYPNADGELIRAKPLFYKDARILLFFTKRYVYNFFGNWPAYNGLPAITGSGMQIVIKDPSENISLLNPPPPLENTTEIPQAIVDWPSDDDPNIPEDVRTLLNLRNPELLNPDYVGGECWASGGQMIRPASVYTEVIPQYLKPLKLYTTVINNLYQGKSREVHRYVFQTSRYATFEEQVGSYHLSDGKGNSRDAIFQLELPLAVAHLDLMSDVVSGTMSAANALLAETWADPFDRLVEGVLKLSPLEAAIGTEFNIVRSTLISAVIGVWIRNPEPFNDPKLPEEVLATSLQVMKGAVADASYKVLFSKDRSQAFVMHPPTSLPDTQLKFRFAYIEWNGNNYVDHSVVQTGMIDLNYSI